MRDIVRSPLRSEKGAEFTLIGKRRCGGDTKKTGKIIQVNGGRQQVFANASIVWIMSMVLRQTPAEILLTLTIEIDLPWIVCARYSTHGLCAEVSFMTL
jgi:hypothetical protein